MPPLDLALIYDHHAQALFAFLLNLTRSDADTRDLLQEVFLKLARRPGMLEGVREPRAFLLRLAHNLYIDLIRRRTTRQERNEQWADRTESVFATTPDPDEDALRQELSVALADLPAEQRAVVHLKLWEGMTFDAIADVLAIPPNTAASRYRYGLDKLRHRLRPLYDEIK